MKFKSLFLGMLGAAVLVSCNNDVIDNNPTPVPDADGIMLSTGADTYFSIALPEPAGTYSGEEAVPGVNEQNLSGDVAVFVYKWDGSNADAEAYAYIPTGYALASKIVMKVKDGSKKIFVSLNSGAAGSTFYGTDLPAAATIADEGSAWFISEVALNKLIWSSGATGWSSTPATGIGSANGLIKAFAGGSFAAAEGVLKTPALATSKFLLTNWDNSVKDTVYGNPGSYSSTCVFNFTGNISKAEATTGTKNQAEITVQRAVAKISLKISAATASANNFISYNNDGSKGHFTPITDGSAVGIWSLGNINKVSTPFQQFNNGAVADPNYTYLSSAHLPAGNNTAWYANFDNTRIFGTTAIYGTTSNTVTNVFAAMRASQNSTDKNNIELGAGYQYATENAQAIPVMHDNATYAVVGGQYKPEYWVSALEQAAVTTNAPFIAYNKATIDNTQVTGTEFYGTAYEPVTYVSVPASADSLYYHTGWKVFIYGKENVYKYYAWVKNADTNTPGTPSSPVAGEYGPGTSLNPGANTEVVATVNADLYTKDLVAYYQGNCFYRVFVTDLTSVDPAFKQEDRVLVRRNHIYDIDITRILGPGIANPNDILVPGKPVLEQDTYIAVSVKVQDWHKISQEAWVKGE